MINDRQLELWVNTQDPADVSGIGKHYRRIVRRDGETVVDSVYSIRSTEEAFHVIIDLNITVNGLLHHQKQWVRSFQRDLL